MRRLVLLEPVFEAQASELIGLVTEAAADHQDHPAVTRTADDLDRTPDHLLADASHQRMLDRRR